MDGFHDAHMQEDPMPSVVEAGGLAVGEVDVSTDVNVELGVALVVAAVAVPVTEGEVDSVQIVAYAYTYLGSSLFLPPLF